MVNTATNIEKDISSLLSIVNNTISQMQNNELDAIIPDYFSDKAKTVFRNVYFRCRKDGNDIKISREIALRFTIRETGEDINEVLRDLNKNIRNLTKKRKRKSQYNTLGMGAVKNLEREIKTVRTGYRKYLKDSRSFR